MMDDYLYDEIIVVRFYDPMVNRTEVYKVLKPFQFDAVHTAWLDAREQEPDLKIHHYMEMIGLIIRKPSHELWTDGEYRPQLFLRNE